jgi:thiol-disulfide isomerase/thioredoxin
MAERLLITLVVLAGLAACWYAWRYYKFTLVRNVRSVEGPTGLPTLLYFTADYCAPCKFQQTPVVERLSEKFGDAVIIKKYDVSQDPELASRYKVLTVPTTVVLDRHGRVAHINYGVTEQARLESQLQ